MRRQLALEVACRLQIEAVGFRRGERAALDVPGSHELPARVSRRLSATDWAAFGWRSALERGLRRDLPELGVGLEVDGAVGGGRQRAEVETKDAALLLARLGERGGRLDPGEAGRPLRIIGDVVEARRVVSRIVDGEVESARRISGDAQEVLGGDVARSEERRRVEDAHAAAVGLTAQQRGTVAAGLVEEGARAARGEILVSAPLRTDQRRSVDQRAARAGEGPEAA